MIELVKPNEPDAKILAELLDEIRIRGWYTNHGPCIDSLELKIQKYLSCSNYLHVANGTLALQLLLRAVLNDSKKKEIITTPYSYVATANAIEWQGLKPIFADLEKNRFYCSPERIEAAIGQNTGAILLTNVYGLPGPIDDYIQLAADHNIPLLFDGAHSFGTKYKSENLSNFGDGTTFSFHSTKTFHTVEGGGITVKNNEVFDRINYYRSFGHRGEAYETVGINAKCSEVHAAYGLAQIHRLDQRLEDRKQKFEYYKQELEGLPVEFIDIPSNVEWNYAYFVLTLNDEKSRDDLQSHLLNKSIISRKYFYPSLDTLNQFSGDSIKCPNSLSIASRVLAIPFYSSIEQSIQEQVVSGIKSFFE